MADSSACNRSYRLVTVNTAPERAYRLVGRLVDALKNRYTIAHIANCESTQASPVLEQNLTLCPAIESVEQTVLDSQPDLLVCFRGPKPSPAHCH